ncbi:MAG: 3-deoxy-8-phosphooctulonate synthase, partial [Verrucomicrobiota bacterium]
MKAKPFKIGSVTIGGKNLLLILGPCVIESERSAFRAARKLKEVTRRLGVPFIFKASYDKANRTSSRSFRGPGLSEGCAILGAIRRELDVPVTTDVHSPAEVDAAAENIDLLQIPAFLCRQTDLISAAAQSGRAVNVKKG